MPPATTASTPVSAPSLTADERVGTCGTGASASGGCGGCIGGGSVGGGSVVVGGVSTCVCVDASTVGAGTGSSLIATCVIGVTSVGWIRTGLMPGASASISTVRV